LIDQWGLLHGTDFVVVPKSAQRLIAYLALHPGCPRSVVAAALWPDSAEGHARSSLRTTARRLRRGAPGLLHPSLDPMSLDTDVRIDAHEMLDLMDRAPREPDPAATVHRLCRMGALLPGWYEDWALLERERLAQLLVVTLEQLGEKLLAEGDHVAAFEAATGCIRLEPLRESAHRLLVRVHLASGNRVAAWQAYEHFRQCSIMEFGLAPDHGFEELIAPLRKERRERSQHHRPGA